MVFTSFFGLVVDSNNEGRFLWGSGCVLLTPIAAFVTIITSVDVSLVLSLSRSLSLYLCRYQSVYPSIYLFLYLWDTSDWVMSTYSPGQPYHLRSICTTIGTSSSTCSTHDPEPPQNSLELHTHAREVPCCPPTCLLRGTILLPSKYHDRPFLCRFVRSPCL